MPTHQQSRSVQTVGLPRPAKPNYQGLFLEPDLPDAPVVEDDDQDDEGHIFTAVNS